LGGSVGTTFVNMQTGIVGFVARSETADVRAIARYGAPNAR
jgi:hypothetical protein